MGHSRHPLTGPERFFWGSQPSTDGGVVRRTVAYLDFVEARSGEEDARTVQQSLELVATRLDVADQAQGKNSVSPEPSAKALFVPSQAELIRLISSTLRDVVDVSPRIAHLDTDVLWQELEVLAATIDAVATQPSAAMTREGEPTGSMFHHLKTHGRKENGRPRTPDPAPPRDPTNPEGGRGIYDGVLSTRRILLTLAVLIILAAVTYSVTYSVVSWVSALR